jgi:hypothetical protein
MTNGGLVKGRVMDEQIFIINDAID